MFRILIATLIAAFAFTAQAAVEVNKANQAELETVKGIGPGLSGKILDARKAGEFKNWTDLVDRVSGVGPGNAARFSQAGLTVNNGAYNAPARDGAATATPVAAKSARSDKSSAAADKVTPAPR